jgi:hypothetical protein
VEYKSSVNEIDRFIGSHVYEDMILDFEDWILGAREKIEAVTDVDEMWRCQGRIQAMKDVLMWAENFRDILDENLKEAENGG